MQIYRHRQIGTLTVALLGFGVVLVLVLLLGEPEFRPVAGPALLVLLAVMVLFHALTVEVTSAEVLVWFGPGLIRKRFRMETIHEAVIVRNPWYYGWGIRLTPHGWMFNVSGLDAVELYLTNSRKFRIGTDDPQGLAAAIQTARELAGAADGIGGE